MYTRGRNSMKRLYPGCISIVKDHLQQSRTYAEKDHPKVPSKDDAPRDMKLSAVNPDTLTEKTCYSQKSQKQLDELRKKFQKQASENPDPGENKQ